MPGPDEADDWDLINRHDSAAMSTLFQRHRDYVFRILWAQLGHQQTAEDLTQEVFLKIASRRRPYFRGAQFRTWLYRVAVNQARDYRRKHRRELPLEDWHLPTQAATHDGADHAVLMAAVARLPDRQRQVVLLRTLEEMSTQETALALGIGQGSIKTHLHRALASLRQMLQQPDN